MASKESAVDPPDFDLAPMVKYSPRVLEGPKDGPDAFMLSLSLAFNDMKGVHWVIRQLNKYEAQQSTDLDASAGQCRGMLLQFHRLSMLVLHEVLTAIRTAESEGILDTDDWSEAVNRLDAKSKRDWKDLVELAHTTASQDPVRNYICQSRNNLAAHYYQPASLSKGYRHFFVETPPSEFNEYALASLGSEVEETRFYFADAAAQMAQKLINPDNALSNEVYSYTLRMFQSLRFLIEGYLRLRNASLLQLIAGDDG